LAICRAVRERPEEARALLNLGISYARLTQYDKAFDYFKQSLQIWGELNNVRAMGRAMNALAVMWERAGSHQKAIDIYQKLLVIQSKMLKDRIGEAETLDNLGFSYASLGQYDVAIDYYKQSLEVQKQTGRLTGVAAPLLNMGLAYFKLGRYREAAAYYEQALAVWRQAKDRTGEALTLANLMSTWSALEAPRLAIFFGKESVNAHQEIRQNIRGLDQSTRTRYLTSYGVTYRQLADLLAREGRLGEAEEVLDLLKEEEFFVYVRGAEIGSPESKSVPLTNPEIQMHGQLLSKGNAIAALALTKRDLETKALRTADEEESLKQLNAKIDEATRDFQQFLDQLSVEFDKHPQGDAQKLRLAHAEALMGTLGELGKGTVALYTLVSEQKYRVILTTSEVEIAGEFAISSADLNRKVEQFRQVLQDRHSDPRPLAQELYRILLGPVENELNGADAQTLMWSLDGSLRYLPVAALYDGQRYLVERYRNEIFNPESLDRLKDPVNQHWRGVGMGVSKSVDNFPPLPGVPSELRGIIRTDSGDGDKGVVPGVLRLNEQFTWHTMQSDLRHSPSVVHIASHFAFKSDIQSSFLLLGDGQKLTLSELRIVPNLFQGVDLLTLSACRTAMGGEEESGSELDGFAMLAQRKGAKSVLATLWPVTDSSTAILMREFYRIRESEPGMTKAEALRQAQTFMLQGKYDPASAQSHAESYTSGPRSAETSVRESYSHPYFWAPFILIGNWK
jgi:pentatricopeptide repeat protein